MEQGSATPLVTTIEMTDKTNNLEMPAHNVPTNVPFHVIEEIASPHQPLGIAEISSPQSSPDIEEISSAQQPLVLADINFPKAKRAYTKRKKQTSTGDKENIPPIPKKCIKI